MNFRPSLLILIEVGLVSFPANIIGCGPDYPDPFDEYITFFRNDVAPVKGYTSFYYVENAVMYNPFGPNADTTDQNVKAWVRYCASTVTIQAADQLINKSDAKDLASLYAHLQKASIPIRAAIRNNPMAIYLLRQHDTTAVKYLWLAKQAEEFTSTGGITRDDRGHWNVRPKEMVGMPVLIGLALQGQIAAKKDFFRARYAFQAERLAFYDQQYEECIHYYDRMVSGNAADGNLSWEGLGYKAGALWHTGRRIEAAYAFSRSFTANPNPSDYQSFDWCVHRLADSDRRACLSQCRNDFEKAEMLGLFVLGSPVPERAALERIYRLAPGTPVQEVLAVREVNKIERNYLTRCLINQKGGKTINELFWFEDDNKSVEWLADAKALIPFYDSLSRNGKVRHPGLFATVAAQLCFISRQYSRGDSLLDQASLLPATEKLRDQQRMTRLLLTINERGTIDGDFEAVMLPTLRWLGRKAFRDSILTVPSELGDQHVGLWRQIYRNLLSEVLAKRYEQQKDRCLEALCIGAAEQIEASPNYSTILYPMSPTEDYVRNRMTTGELMHLLRLLQGSAQSGWERYLVPRFPVAIDELKQAISVAHIREHQFHNALAWMKKIKDTNFLVLKRDPFADLLFDAYDRLLPLDKGHFGKVKFIAEMAGLSDKVRAHKATAQDLYRLATGYYNMTYYGRAWKTVKYFRSSNEDDDMPKDRTDFDADYYGCYTAEAYYKRAMAASTDREFKARCLFMMEKCSQKREMPGHYIHFPQLVREYGDTKFYKEVFNTCSYLQDFVDSK
jgi:hypothetical protein